MNHFLKHWQAAHSFILRNFLILLLLPLGIWGFSGVQKPVFFPNTNFDMEESYSRSVPHMGKMAVGMGGGIAQEAFFAPDVMADDGFDQREGQEQKVVKNGGVDIQVDDTDMMRAEVEKKVQEFSGKVQNVSSWQVRQGVLGYNITARIPAEKFDTVLKEIGKLGQKTGENMSSQDITRQYYDTKNQIKNLEARRDRLRKLLEFETKSLADVLSVDRELTSVQTQIERLQNVQNKRDTDVAYSTLRIGIQPIPQVGDTGNPHWSAKQSWRTAVNNLIEKSQNVFDWVLKYVALAPMWIPALLILIWLRRKFWKRKQNM